MSFRDPLTPAQKGAIEFWNGFNVPVKWFVGATQDDDSREFIALGVDGERQFIWSLLVRADGSVSDKEAYLEENAWETGIEI